MGYTVDLCSGQTGFEQCSMETLSKLAEALGIDTKELVLLETGNDMDEDGRFRDKKYLETGLPESQQHFLDEFIQGKKNYVSHMDCLWGGRITKGHADYLRAKYLFGEEAEGVE